MKAYELLYKIVGEHIREEDLRVCGRSISYIILNFFDYAHTWANSHDCEIPPNEWLAANLDSDLNEWIKSNPRSVK